MNFLLKNTPSKHPKKKTPQKKARVIYIGKKQPNFFFKGVFRKFFQAADPPTKKKAFSLNIPEKFSALAFFSQEEIFLLVLKNTRGQLFFFLFYLFRFNLFNFFESCSSSKSREFIVSESKEFIVSKSKESIVS